MIKISALNDKEAEDENDSEIKMSAEALLQIASQQYAKALDLQRKGSLEEATQLLKDLLDTELLYNVKLPNPREVSSAPLYNLKYLCYKNLAFMLQEAGDIDTAIEAYIDASDFDDTDVTLWYRLGLICMQAKQFEKALVAFQRGYQRNPRHWQCLDNIVKLLLALNYREQCISTIHDALQLDPGYLRGIVYRRHIYTIYKYMRQYMQDLNPIYKWNEDDDDPVDEIIASKLLKEADDIHESFIDQQKRDNFVHVVPYIKLKKPITKDTWEAVGESLIHMHHYQTEHCLSHACFIDIGSQTENTDECMDVWEEENEAKLAENKVKENVDSEKITEIVSENENNDLSDKDKAMTDSEKVESDVEMVASESATENNAEDKTQKKNSVRRRGSALSFLHPWEWCTRRSARKKTGNKQDSIYDILRKMVPVHLEPEIIQKKEREIRESSPDVTDLDKLFPDVLSKDEENIIAKESEYFGTEAEENDVKAFVKLYTEDSKDIIDILNDYLKILSDKWNQKWSDGLCKVFVAANECYNNHIDVPSLMDDAQHLTHYCQVNMIAEELSVNEKISKKSNEKLRHDLNRVSEIDMIVTSKPHLFSNPSCLEMILRSLWIKLHVHFYLTKSEDMALETGYDLLDEFDAMGQFAETYSLNVVNFKIKPDINRKEILAYVQTMEKTKRLSSVMDLYNKGCYEQVISIITESFEESKKIAMDRDNKLPLDFEIQLTLILESHWASGNVNDCLKWSFISLHESLKHYFRFTSGSDNYETWTLVVIKILTCTEHILVTEGLACLDSVSTKVLSEGLEDLIRIIGHQVETNSSEMPFNTFSPWIIMHYILQREEDLGRGSPATEEDSVYRNGIPYPIMILFIAHNNLGERNWCCNSDGKFLYFILDTVVPSLRSPLLSNCFQNICQYMEQVVLCLYAHPNKINNKMKHLRDHKAAPKVLTWKRAEQIYEIFRPADIPAIEGKIPEISIDTEALFHRILSLLPPECDLSKYVSEIDKYVKGIEEKFTPISPNFPFKIRDIYLYLCDYYFKKEDHQKTIKYSMLDIAINNDRFNSWALLSLSKVFFLDRSLSLYKKFNNERDYLIPAKSAIRCFKRALELNPKNYNLWLEFGNFLYNVHSYCSRLLKQDSESLSMEEFESLERQKEDLLDESYKCYTKVLYAPDDSDLNEDSWPLFYMLGKVAEKRNKSPSVYLDYYMRGIKKLQEAQASYPSKISYKSPSNLSVKVLELHYRMHASILKYIEQHENKPIPASVGKVFLNCIEQWLQGPFVKKPKDTTVGNTSTVIRNEVDMAKKYDEPQAGNILKRSISDAGEEDTQEVKRLKTEAAAAKIRRSASYDTERVGVMDPSKPNSPDKDTKEDNKTVIVVPDKRPEIQEVVEEQDAIQAPSPTKVKETIESVKEDSSSSSSSTSSSDSNSSDSSSSSSDSSSDTSSKSSQENKQLPDEEIMKIVSACLDALEDCAIRFQPNYKAIYRLAHYHFYYKKGRDIERCRDLMLSTLISRSGQKMCGLFSEKKTTNFFNNIWKFPGNDIERAGGFAFHMNRCVLLTLEIFKEIDDHKTLLDLSLHLQIEPDLEKKYLRDSDREDLAQQAFSLCVQLLKGQLLRFSQQSDLKINEVERHALKSFMTEILKAYQKVQRTANAKHLTTLLVDAYKLLNNTPVSENINLVELSIKYCQSLTHKQQPMVNIEKNQNLQKKQSSKFQSPSVNISSTKVQIPINQSKAETKSTAPNISAPIGLPKISAQEMAAAIQSYAPMFNDISQQTAAALSLTYLSNISALAGLTSLQNQMQSSLQTSLQNSYQAEYYRQYLGSSFPAFNLPQQQKKPKRGRPVGSTSANIMKSKSFSNSLGSIIRAAPSAPSRSSSMTSVSKTSSFPKATPTPVITSLQKSTSCSLTPSMGTVLSSLPASMTANLSSFGAHGHSSSLPTHISSSSKSHQQVSPGKTLQEKLAERQKNIPSLPKTSQEISASLNRLPSSLTITKTSVAKHSQAKKPEAKKSLTFENDQRPKPITSDEVIVLDDD